MEARISVFSSLAQHIGDQVLTRRRCRRSAPVTMPRPRPLQNRCFELELHARAACLTFACFGSFMRRAAHPAKRVCTEFAGDDFAASYKL